jgi:hypothetical protein
LYFAWDIVLELAGLVLFFLVGFLLEQLNPVERIYDSPGLIRNYVLGYFFLFGQELSVIGLGFILAREEHVNATKS